MDNMDYYEWEESQKRFSPSKIMKFAFKFISTAIIVTTFALLLGRMALMRVPGSFTGVTATAGIVSSVENGSFDAMIQEPAEPYNNNGKKDKGWYHVSNVALAPSADEVQITVRYNSRSTINTLIEKYELSERPSGEVFVYTLTDNLGNVYTDYVFSAKSRLLYEFRRVVFTGVELEGVETLSVNIYYIEDVSSDGRMSSTIEIYNNIYAIEEPEPNKLKGKNLKFASAPEFDKTFIEDITE